MKKVISILGVSAIIFQIGIGTAQSINWTLIENFNREPTIEEVQKSGCEYNRLNYKEYEAVINRSKLQYILPEIEAKTHYGEGIDEGLQLKSVDQSYAKYDIDSDKDIGITVTVKFNLNRLLYNNEEIKARYQFLRVIERRERFLNFITELYFKRRKLQISYIITPPQDPKEKLEMEIEFVRLTSILDAMTGYKFHKRWLRSLDIK